MVLLRALLVALLAGLALRSPAGAQGEVPAPDAAEIQGRIAALTGSDAEHRDELVATYQKVLEELERARQLALKSADLQRQIQEAPALLAAIQEELAQPPKTGPPATDPAAPDAGAADLAHLTNELEQAEANRIAASAQVDELSREGGRRSERLSAIPDELAKARQRMAELQESLGAAGRGDALARARYALLAAQLATQRAQAETLELERSDYEARRELLGLRQQRARRQAARAQELASYWRTRVSEARMAQAEAQVRETARQLAETTAEHPELSELAGRNEELASLRSGPDGIPAQIDAARQELERARELEREVEERFRNTRTKIAIAGLTPGMGTLLRREYDWLPPARRLKAESIARKAQLSREQLLLIGVDENGDAAPDEAALMAELLPAGQQDPDGSLAGLVHQLVETEHSLRQSLTTELGSLIDTLLEHEGVHERLMASTEAYRTYIEERILWIRSTSGSLLPDPTESLQALRWLLSGSQWLEAGRRLGSSAELSWPPTVLCTLAIVLALVFRRRARSFVLRSANLVRSYRSDRFVHTLRALLDTLVLACPGPLGLWLLGSVLTAPIDQVEVAGAVGHAAKLVAPSYLALAFLRATAKEKRLGEVHFRWRAESMRALRRELRWFVPLIVPLMLATFTFERAGHTANESAGRMVFVAYSVVAAVFLFRLLHREASILDEQLARSETILARTHALWFRVAAGFPLALGLAALGGYYYTALQLEQRFRASVGLALALVVANALLQRWLFITRRRLAVELARQRVQAREEKQEDDAEAVRESGAQVDEDAVDIPSMDAQTRQIFRTGLTVAALFGFVLIWSGAFPALRFLDRIHLWPQLELVGPETLTQPVAQAPPAASAPALPGVLPAESLPSSPSPEPARATETARGTAATAAHVVTLGDAGLALVLLILMTLAARNIPGLLEFTVLQRMPLDSGARFAFTTLIRYLILILGTSAAFGAIGIGWNTIQWLAAALTFGLAFGLQEIFANFVSGIIILLERPVRVGDIVTVDGIDGRVTKLRMRATTILDWDRREYLVPNKQFITGNVVNWTLTDPVTRMTIKVGIAYGSDTKLAHQLLLEVARSSPYALAEPAPQAIFTGFGESSLDFELRVFMKDRDLWPTLIDQMHTGIDEAFRKAGIEIAFPQRDLHIRSAEGLRGATPAPPPPA